MGYFFVAFFLPAMARRGARLVRAVVGGRWAPAGAALGARVGLGRLAPARQPLAMAGPAIAADIHQPLDVHRDLGAERALDLDASLDELAEPGHLGVREIADPGVGVDPRVAEQPVAGGPADPI